MLNKSFLKHNKTQYKANFHMHTTVSDGSYTPEEAIQAYQKQGYSVLVISDHEIYTNTTQYDTNNMIVLGGIERSVKALQDEEFHFNGILNPQTTTNIPHGHKTPVYPYDNIEVIQKVIDELKEDGNYVILNHPSWSCNRMKNILQLKNYDAMEVYNHESELSEKVGYSETYVESIIWEDQILPHLVATDDSHGKGRYDTTRNLNGFFGGWVNICSESFTRQAIFNNIQQGNYYASTGVTIEQYGIKDNKIFIQCSPCTSVTFMISKRRGYTINATDDNNTYFEYTLRGREDTVRIICTNDQHKHAWTTPFKLK